MGFVEGHRAEKWRFGRERASETAQPQDSISLSLECVPGADGPSGRTAVSLRRVLHQSQASLPRSQLRTPPLIYGLDFGD